MFTINYKKIKNRMNKQNTMDTTVDIYNSVGILAKRKRHELNMTLKEVAEDICSISYLSKIESNKVVPNERFLTLLFEKMKISKAELFVLENAQVLLDNLINAIYLGDIEAIENLYDIAKDIKNNHFASVVQIIYNLIHENTKEAGSIIKDTVEYLGSAPDLVVRLLTLSTAYYYLLIGEYLKSLDLINSFIQTGNYRLDLLVKDLSFRIYARMGRLSSASILYKDLMTSYSNSLHLIRIQSLKKEFIKMLFDACEYKAIIESMGGEDFINKSTEDPDINAIVGISLYKLGYDIASKDYFDKLKPSSEQYYKTIEYRYRLSNDKEQFIKQAEEENSKDNNFYLDYFLKKKNNKIEKELFHSTLFETAFSKGSIKERITLYKLEKEYLTSIYKYKEVMLIDNKIIEMMENGYISDKDTVSPNRIDFSSNELML